MTLVRFIARPMLASLFIVQGLKTLRDPDSMVARAKPVTDRITPLLEKYAPQVPTETRTLVRINAGIHVVAGAMLATGTFSRVAAAALAGSMVPTTLAGHPFWEIEDPDEKRSQRLQFLKNVGMTGGLLLAAVDTEGRPASPGGPAAPPSTRSAWRRLTSARRSSPPAPPRPRSRARPASCSRLTLGVDGSGDRLRPSADFVGLNADHTRAGSADPSPRAQERPGHAPAAASG